MSCNSNETQTSDIIHVNVNAIVDLRLAIHNNVVGFSLGKCDPLPSVEKRDEKSGGREVVSCSFS